MVPASTLMLTPSKMVGIRMSRRPLEMTAERAVARQRDHRQNPWEKFHVSRA